MSLGVGFEILGPHRLPVCSLASCSCHRVCHLDSYLPGTEINSFFLVMAFYRSSRAVTKAGGIPPSVLLQPSEQLWRIAHGYLRRVVKRMPDALKWCIRLVILPLLGSVHNCGLSLFCGQLSTVWRSVEQLSGNTIFRTRVNKRPGGAVCRGSSLNITQDLSSM